jgi:hypothetical protein
MWGSVLRFGDDFQVVTPVRRMCAAQRPPMAAATCNRRNTPRPLKPLGCIRTNRLSFFWQWCWPDIILPISVKHRSGVTRLLATQFVVDTP